MHLLFDNTGVPKRELENIAHQVVAVIDRVATHSRQHEGVPLVAMENSVLAYVLKPLPWCTTLPATKNSAQKTFLAVCDLLEASGSLAYEIPVYREYLGIALSGADISQGLDSKCFRETSIRLMKVKNEYRTQRAMQQLQADGLVEVFSEEAASRN